MGFGTMGLSAFYGAVGSDEERFKILDRAYELGELNWDSADMYAVSLNCLEREEVVQSYDQEWSF